LSHRSQLAWQFVAWALEHGGVEARTTALAEFELARETIPEAPRAATPREELLLAGGIVPETLHRILHSEAVNQVVLVCAEALLARSSGEITRELTVSTPATRPDVRVSV
jgi:hypothetical protein